MRESFHQGRWAGTAILCGLLLTGTLAQGVVFTTPLTFAEPSQVPAPRGPVPGQPCDDLDKLAYDPSVGQIVCTRQGWAPSVTPVGVRPIGERCAVSEMDSVMASSTDGHLIFCPSNSGVWTLYRP
jgi:hypothetical protein